MLEYRAIMHREDGSFWIEFPDFPEIVHHGAPGEDPAVAAAETLADAIVLRIVEGEDLPEPTSGVAPVDGELLVVTPRRNVAAIAAE
jgi:antitoxin HicB